MYPGGSNRALITNGLALNPTYKIDSREQSSGGSEAT
jgi:hypothetical protein